MGEELEFEYPCGCLMRYSVTIDNYGEHHTEECYYCYEHGQEIDAAVERESKNVRD